MAADPAPAPPWATLGALAAVLVLALAPASWGQALALQRDAWAHQPWRLWTAHWVHHGAAHAVADGLGLAVAGVLAERLVGARRWWLGCAVGAPLLSLAVLAAEPALRDYRGASGLVVMLATLVGVAGWQQRALPRPWLALAAAAFAAKVAWDAATALPTSPWLPSGVRVAWSAHAGGALLGLGWGLARRAAGPRR